MSRIDNGSRRLRTFDMVRGALVLAVVIGIRYVRIVYVIALGSLVVVRSLIAGGGVIAARVWSVNGKERRAA